MEEKTAEALTLEKPETEEIELSEFPLHNDENFEFSSYENDQSEEASEPDMAPEEDTGNSVNSEKNIFHTNNILSSDDIIDDENAIMTPTSILDENNQALSQDEMTINEPISQSSGIFDETENFEHPENLSDNFQDPENVESELIHGEESLNIEDINDENIHNNNEPISLKNGNLNNILETPELSSHNENKNIENVLEPIDLTPEEAAFDEKESIGPEKADFFIDDPEGPIALSDDELDNVLEEAVEEETTISKEEHDEIIEESDIQETRAVQEDEDEHGDIKETEENIQTQNDDFFRAEPDGPIALSDDELDNVLEETVEEKFQLKDEITDEITQESDIPETGTVQEVKDDHEDIKETEENIQTQND
ncbi:MAG: hypothetical protein OEZ13_05755, partial [Spirochaetia bacterium]|nr:hypothetical protein [Spirochaetia bacterium]